MMTRTENLKNNIDLLTLIEEHTNLKRVSSSGGGEWAGPCPFPGCDRKVDGFRVQPFIIGGGRWLCRGCTDGKWEDVISFVMRLNKIDFKGAIRLLGGKDVYLSHRRVKQQLTSTPSNPLESVKWYTRVL